MCSDHFYLELYVVSDFEEGQVLPALYGSGSKGLCWLWYNPEYCPKIISYTKIIGAIQFFTITFL